MNVYTEWAPICKVPNKMIRRGNEPADSISHMTEITRQMIFNIAEGDLERLAPNTVDFAREHRHIGS